jgi:hypothetical protein
MDGIVSGDLPALWELGSFTRENSTSVGTAAKAIGISECTLRRWCIRHKIGKRCGGRWFISKSALAQMLGGDRGAVKRPNRPSRT